MRPVRLIMEGFGAFRDRVEIDFSTAEFFALVGPTGSGKSTVIDAICFALYGSVPRYEDKGLVAPALSTGANQARVQLTFMAGGQVFNAARVVQRTARGATTKEARLELVSQAHGAERHDTKASGASDVTKAVESLLGLTFEHFTRCVVLPQGDFAKFLHDTPKDRQDVLVKLLQLDIYKSMMQAANARAQSANEEIRTLTARLDELGDISEESIDVLRLALEKIDELEATLAPITERLEAIQVEGGEATAARKSLDIDLANLRGLELPPGVRELADSVAATNELIAAASLEVATAEHSQTAATARVAQSSDPSELRGQLRDVAELAATEASLAELGEQIDGFIQQSESAQEQVALASAELDQKRALLEPISELMKAVEAHRSLNDITLRISGAAAEQLRAAESLEALAATTASRSADRELAAEIARTRPTLQRLVQLLARREAVAAEAEELEGTLAACSSDLALAEEVNAQLISKVDNLATHLRLLERNHMASTIAATLHRGDECPVCQNTVGELGARAGDAEVSAAQEQLEVERARSEHARNQVELLRGDRAHRTELLRAARTSAAQITEMIQSDLTAERESSHPTLLLAAWNKQAGDGQLPRETVERALADSASAEQQLFQLDRELADLRAQAESARMAEARTSAEIETLKERQQELETLVAAYPNVEELEARIALTKSYEAEVASAESLLRKRQSDASKVREALAKLEGSFDALRSRYQSLVVRCSSFKPVEEIRSDLEAAENAAVALQEANRDLALKISALRSCQSKNALLVKQETAAVAQFHEARDRVARLNPPPFVPGSLTHSWDSLVLWASDQMQSIDTNIGTLIERIADLANERTKLRSERSALINRSIGSLIGDQATNQEVDNEIARARAERTAKLETIERNRGRAATLMDSKRQQQEVADVASELGRLLSAKRFEGWLVNTALRSLTIGASQILERLSGNEYALEVTESNEFQVVDHRNADQRRPVRSLSGGETFQASLALALALSQQIGGLSAQPGRSLDSIFLDEGFGTLDPATLDMVANTIETLGQDGRMVGIITHVQELAERVPVRFHVSKGDRTSTVSMENSFG